jgi:hypothetical protein
VRRALILAGLVVAAAAAPASAGASAPTLTLTPVWKSGTMVRIGIVGRRWIVSAECPDAVPLSYVVRGSGREVPLAGVTLRRATGAFVFTWEVPPVVRGHVVAVRMRESCVSVAGGRRVFAASATVRVR